MTDLTPPDTLTADQVKQLHDVCRGVDFDLVLDLERLALLSDRARLSGGRGEHQQALSHPFATLCNTVADRIGTAPDKSALGGENVLAVFHADDHHASSIHLMHFRGRQDMHFHPGPRLLSIISDEPWFLYIGGDGPSVVNNDVIPVVKIAFPGSSVTLVRFRSNLLHGFEGENFAAISSHYTDLWELYEIGVQAEELTDSASDQHVMKELTLEVEQDRLKTIFAGAISAYDLVDVLSRDPERAVTETGTATLD